MISREKMLDMEVTISKETCVYYGEFKNNVYQSVKQILGNI